MALASSPADQIASLLPDTIVTADPTWVVKVGQVVNEPDRQIVFFDTGGQNPDPRWKLDYMMVQAQIRGNPNDYTSGWQKARQVRDFFLGIEPQTLPSGDRIDGIICMGDVAFLANDDQRRPLFSVNFRVIWEPGDDNTTSREPL